jgi:alginate export protein
MNKRTASTSVWFTLGVALSASAQDPPKDAPDPGVPKQEAPSTIHVESFVKRLLISGEFRTRFEFRDPLGYANPVQLEENQDFLHIRVRLNFDVQVTDHLRGFVQIQDQRFAGQEPVGGPGSGNPLLPFSTASGDGKNTDVHQAFIEIQDLWDEDLDIKIGRFNMCYGSRRLLCNFDWHPVGNAWDGIHGHYGKEKFWIDAWYTIVQERNAPVTSGASIEDASDDVDFWGFYSQYRIGPEFAVEGFLYARRAQFDVPPAGQNPYEDETFGLRIVGEAGGFDYEAEFALQTGTNSPTGLADLDKKAKGGAAQVGYRFLDLPWIPRLAVEYTYASGDSDPADGDDESFSPPYPGAHIYNGYTDQVAMRNIREWKFIVQAEPLEDVVFELDYFLFHLDRVEDAWFNYLQVPIRPGDPTGAASKDLGTEFDLHARWTYDKKLSFWGGLTWFWPGGFVEDTAGTDKSMKWYFLQATLTF